MSVSITWSLSNGGAAITSVSHGSGGAGTNLSEKTLYLSHDGDNQITDCGFYIAELTGTYTGGSSKANDLAEIIDWGDGITAASFGGLLFNMDAVGGWPTWPTYSSKSGTAYNVIRTGTGDTAANKIVLPIGSGISSTGIIPTGDSPNVRLKCRINIPSDATGLYTRQFDVRFRYTYTS